MTSSYFALTELIEEHTRNFTGREWVFEEIDRWLAEPDGSRFFLLTGPPGSGKSAIAARLVQISQGQVQASEYSHLAPSFLAHAHFCRVSDPASLRPARFVEGLSRALAGHLPSFSQALLEQSRAQAQPDIIVNLRADKMASGAKMTGIQAGQLTIQVFGYNMRAAFDDLVRRPLQRLETEAPAAPAVILIDALDRALTYHDREHLVRLLQVEVDVDEGLPDWLHFLLTTRPDDRIQLTRVPDPLDLVGDAPTEVDDVAAYVRDQLPALEPTLRLRLAGKIADDADGDFLYARVLLDDIEAGRQSLDDLGTLPTNLDDIYHRFLTNITATDWEASYQRLFGVLAVAAEPVTEEQLARFSGLRSARVRHYLNAAEQFLHATPDEEQPERFILFHESLREYLVDEERNQDFWYAPEDSHLDIAAYYLQWHQADWSTCDDYGLRHLPHHLRGANHVDALQQLLLDYRWLQAKLEKTDASSLLADYELFAERELQLLYQALRLSSHVLARDPAQLPSQLWGRLLDYPEEQIQVLLEQAKVAADRPWLRPLTRTLDAPGGPLVRTLSGHADWVTAVAVAPDGRYAISGSQDNTLKVWDLDSGRMMRTLAGHSDWVMAAAVTPDGRYAISGSGDKTLKVWELVSGREVRTLEGHSSPVHAVTVTPDGHYALSGSYDQTLKVWELKSGRQVRTLIGHNGPVNAVAVTPDGHYAVSGSDDKTLKVWDLDSGRELHTLAGHEGSVLAATVTRDGRYAISGSYDQTLKVWELNSGREMQTLTGHGELIYAVAVTRDGRHVVSGSADLVLKVWELKSGSEVRTLAGHSLEVVAVAVTPDARYAVSGSADQTLKIWELDSGMEVRAPAKHDDGVTAVAVTPDGRFAVSGSADQTLKVWKTDSCRAVRTLVGHSDWVTAASVTVDGHYVVSGSDDKTLKVWDLDSGGEVRTLVGHAGPVKAVTVTPDGHYAVSAESWDQTLTVWDLESAKEARTLTDHTGWIEAVTVTPDGRYAISGSQDQTLKVWELASGRVVRTLDGHSDWVTAVAVTPDGRHAVSGSEDGTLKVWELDSGREVRTLPGHAWLVATVAVTPDGRYVVSGSQDQTLKVWELEAGRNLVTFNGESPILCCAVGPDSRLIVTGDRSGRVHFLRLEGLD